jgi:hypothetical protein
MVQILLLPLLLSVFYAAVSGQSNTVTITDFPSYSDLRPCAAQSCIEWKIDGLSEFVLASAIGCNVQSAPENNCFCRTDLINSAATWLSNCVSSSCSSNTNDITSATSIYLAYCSQAGYFPASAQATTTLASIATSTNVNTATGDTSPAATAVAPTSEPTSKSGSVNSSNGGDSSSSGLSPGIDTGIAIASLVVSILTLWVGWITYKWMTKSKSM